MENLADEERKKKEEDEAKSKGKKYIPKPSISSEDVEDMIQGDI